MSIRSYCRWEMGPPASTSTQMEMGELRTHLPARGGGPRPRHAPRDAQPRPLGTAPAGAAAAQACAPGVRSPGPPAGPRALACLVGLPQQLVGGDTNGTRDEN